MPRRSEPEPYALKLGARIRELRLERNMSLAALADAAQLSKGTSPASSTASRRSPW
ncbi:hypothetical protein [Polyangium spumosum]|uniref:HTH cro/C1-type domain-containing protein n=1 Tax=Polyangium spumosum TaxID=889282 RepID=A0A6N7Q556_9BACT|nr:hypothetical protein [Polyangium spumosum]MRG97815.1 hypothetical protein [Polyangium spumosum]